MTVEFNNKEYKKNGRNGTALKDLCFDIFKHYLELNNQLTYADMQNIFNKWHCRNNFIVLSKEDWEKKTDDLKKRYFNPIKYNNEDIYFTTQWGNNGGDCDNVNNMIGFAKKQNYNIKVMDDMIEQNNMNIKNIILYGAPGVGKTHNYQNIISMIEEGRSQKDIFDTVSKNLHVDLQNETFESIKKDGRVEFVTFHQSYSYEDFIEGFRPSENNHIKLQDGIFKLIAESARKNLDESQKNKDDVKYEKSIEYKLEDFINDSIDNEKEFKKTKQGVFKIESFDNDKILIFAPDSNYNENRLELSFLELLKVALYEDDINSSKNMAKLIFDKNNQRQSDTYYYNIFKEFEKVKDSLQTVEIDENNQLKNFYIVIDEINRGNISKIFGELITLIEEDKRDGYEVTLPYSKEKFKVPSNLYIIATMNSTDKSIATIDIALRRRFTFLKMKPNVDLVHVKARELFNDLNKFIKENLNEDYMLGHSYFMKIENDEDLEFVKEYKIKPLLEEYFYADEKNYKKAVAILNKENQND